MTARPMMAPMVMAATSSAVEVDADRSGASESA
jgi:hypothetical protein